MTWTLITLCTDNKVVTLLHINLYCKKQNETFVTVPAATKKPGRGRPCDPVPNVLTGGYYAGEHEFPPEYHKMSFRGKREWRRKQRELALPFEEQQSLAKIRREKNNATKKIFRDKQRTLRIESIVQKALNQPSTSKAQPKYKSAQVQALLKKFGKYITVVAKAKVVV